MAMWLWINGAPGSPGNDGWLEVLSASGLNHDQTARFSVRPDCAMSPIFSMLVHGDLVDQIMFFMEPQFVIRYYQSIITAASSSRDGSALAMTISFSQQAQSYSG